MKSCATARPPGRSRSALIAAGVLALLGWFAVTAPARAGYYGDSDYGSYPCSYRCGYDSPYRYSPYRYQPRYYHRRPSLVYERRFYEREFVERRYAWPPHHYHRHYGYRPYGRYGSYPYWSRRFPWGYGGVRSWRAPYGYRYEPSAERYEEPPRPSAPIWDGANEGVPYGDESARFNAGESWQRDPALQAPVGSYGVAAVPQVLPRGPLSLIASGLLGFLNPGTW